MKTRILFWLLICSTLPVGAKDFYLAGAFNGWEPNQESYKFTEINGVYSLELASITGDMKITTSAWEEQYGCGSSIEYGVTYPVIQSGNGYNIVLPDDPANDITIIFDYNNKTLRVEKSVTLYLVGDFNGWMPLPKYRFVKNGDLYQLRTNEFTGRFKIASEDYSVSFGYEGEIKVDITQTVKQDGNDMTYNGSGSTKGKILITFDPSYDKLPGDYGNEETPSTPDNPDEEQKPSVPNDPGQDEIPSTPEDPDQGNTPSTPEGPDQGNTPSTPETPGIPGTPDEQEPPVDQEPPADQNPPSEPENPEPEIPELPINPDYDESGVAEISTNDEGGRAEFFNLQGQKIRNPQHGVFIMVLNREVKKVYIP